jgi:hypothetical protein
MPPCFVRRTIKTIANIISRTLLGSRLAETQPERSIRHDLRPIGPLVDSLAREAFSGTSGWKKVLLALR